MLIQQFMNGRTLVTFPNLARVSLHLPGSHDRDLLHAARLEY